MSIRTGRDSGQFMDYNSGTAWEGLEARLHLAAALGRDYFPIRGGARWSYEVREPGKAPTSLDRKIFGSEVGGGFYEYISGKGRDEVRLEVGIGAAGDVLYRGQTMDDGRLGVDQPVTLIPARLKAGESYWDESPGAYYLSGGAIPGTVTLQGKVMPATTVRVPDGAFSVVPVKTVLTFDGSIEVNGHSASLKIVSTEMMHLAKGVGIVKLEQTLVAYMRLDDKSQTSRAGGSMVLTRHNGPESPLTNKGVSGRSTDVSVGETGVSKLVLEMRHRLVFALGLQGLTVADVDKRKVLGRRDGKFSDLDVSADGKFLFAVEAKRGKAYVHRYDLLERTWEAARELPGGAAGKVEAADGRRFVVVPQGKKGAVYRWEDNGTVKKLAGTEVLGGDVEFDARKGRLIHGALNGALGDLGAWKMGADGKFARGESKGGVGVKGDWKNASLVLSSGGEGVYFGRWRVDAGKVNKGVREFPKPIFAATKQIAFAENTYYDAATGQTLGYLPVTSRVMALSAEGSTLAVMDDTTVRLFRVPGAEVPKKEIKPGNNNGGNGGEETPEPQPPYSLPGGVRYTKKTAAPQGMGFTVAYASEHGLLIYDKEWKLVFRDMATGQETVKPLAHRLWDFDVSPDGRWLFAVDAVDNGGKQIHRLDLENRTWDAPRELPTAGSIEVVDGERFIIGTRGQGPLGHDLSLTLYRWDSDQVTVTGLSEGTVHWGGPFVYDAVGDRVIVQEVFSDDEKLMAYRLEEGSFGKAEESGDWWRPLSSVVLSTDSKDVYLGSGRTEAMDVAAPTWSFGHPITAATGRLAFSPEGYCYDADTGVLLGKLPVTYAQYVLNRAGTELYALNYADRTLHHFTLPADSAAPPAPFVKETLSGGVEHVGTVSAYGNVKKVVVEPAHGLAFAMNSGGAIRVIDLETGEQVGVRLAKDRFTDLDLSPSGRFLYAADYGYPYVHRYDLEARTWEVRAIGMAHRVEVVDDEHFVTLGKEQWVKADLYRWDAEGLTLLARSTNVYSGDIEYDPATRRLIHATYGVSPPTVSAFVVTLGESPAITAAESYQDWGLGGQETNSLALSSDGTRFYYGGVELDGHDVRVKVRNFSPLARAASGAVVFAENGYYAAATGAKLGALPYTSVVYGVSADGSRVVAYNWEDRTLRVYLLPAAGA